ncbi:unnamed protein product [Caretta caretta]
MGAGQLYCLVIKPFLCLLCWKLKGLMLLELELRLVLFAYADDILLVVQDPGDLVWVEACQTIYSPASSARVSWVKSSGLVVRNRWQVNSLPPTLQAIRWSVGPLLSLSVYLSATHPSPPENWQAKRECSYEVSHYEPVVLNVVAYNPSNGHKPTYAGLIYPRKQHEFTLYSSRYKQRAREPTSWKKLFHSGKERHMSRDRQTLLHSPKVYGMGIVVTSQFLLPITIPPNPSPPPPGIP